VSQLQRDYPRFLAGFRVLPRDVWILVLGTFFNSFGTFVVPFLTIYLTWRGHSLEEAGLSLTAYGVGHFVASLLGGHLADRLGRRRTIMLSMFSSAAAMLLLSQAEGCPAVACLALLAGLCAELYRPASNALLTELCPPDQWVTAWALYRLALNLGYAAGPIVAGLLSRGSFFLLFVGDAATSVLFGLVAWLATAAPWEDKHHALKAEDAGSGVLAALGDRRLLALLLAELGVAVVDFQSVAVLPLHVERAGFSGATYGALLSITGGLIILFEVPLTAVTRRLSLRWMLALGCLLSGSGIALTGLAYTIPVLTATVVVWTLGEMIGSPLGSAYLSGLAPEHLRGRYMGLRAATWSLGMLLGPFMGMQLFDRSPVLLWWVCGALGALSALVVVLGLEPRRAEAGETRRIEAELLRAN
jgi:MFS family permease